MCQALYEIMEEDFKKAEARGKASGEAIGVYKTLAELVKDRVISLAEDARRAGVSESDFKKNAGLTTV